MTRRRLLLAAGAMLPWLHAWAQPAKPPRRIGFLSPSTRELSKPNIDEFRSALKGLGYVEGRDVVIEVRWSDGISERLPELARELLSLNPAVLLTATNLGAATLKAATSTVPVVFISVGAPAAT